MAEFCEKLFKGRQIVPLDHVDAVQGIFFASCRVGHLSKNVIVALSVYRHRIFRIGYNTAYDTVRTAVIMPRKPDHHIAARVPPGNTQSAEVCFRTGTGKPDQFCRRDVLAHFFSGFDHQIVRRCTVEPAGLHFNGVP